MNKAIGPAPFNFPVDKDHPVTISKIWLDEAGDLFIANNTDTIYSVANATKPFNEESRSNIPVMFITGLDKDSNLIVTHSTLAIKKFSLGKGVIPYSFAQGSDESGIILVGTNKGLYAYDKQPGQNINYLFNEKSNSFTIAGMALIVFSTVKWG